MFAEQDPNESVFSENFPSENPGFIVQGALKSITVNVDYHLLAVRINSILNCENRCFQSSKTFGLLLFFVCICILFVIFVPHGESDLKSYHYQTSSCSIALVSVHTFQ